MTAKGSPDIALSWIFDLQLGMARLFGVLCSAALDSRKGTNLVEISRNSNISYSEVEKKLDAFGITVQSNTYPLLRDFFNSFSLINSGEFLLTKIALAKKFNFF